MTRYTKKRKNRISSEHRYLALNANIIVRIKKLSRLIRTLSIGAIIDSDDVIINMTLLYFINVEYQHTMIMISVQSEIDLSGQIYICFAIIDIARRIMVYRTAQI